MSAQHGSLSIRGQRVLALPAPGEWMPHPGDDDINLASGYPSPEVIPMTSLETAFLDLVRAEGDRPFQYQGSQRAADLRQWMLHRMADEMRPNDRLLGTMGALQGLDLASRAVLEADTAVLVQSPTYMEALEIFRNYTDHIVGIPESEAGFSIDQVEAALVAQVKRGVPVRLIYWGADFQNPTGRVTPEIDRQRLVELAHRFNLWIIEDAAYRPLFFFDQPIRSIKSYDDGQRVLYLGTLSKTVAPGLRVGWAVGPEPWVEAMERLKKDLGQPFVEAVVGQYLATHDYEAHLKRLRSHYHQRASVLWDALRGMPPGVTMQIPEGGFFLWLTLPHAWDSLTVANRLQRAGVGVLAGHFFCPRGAPDPHAVRLSFSLESEPRLVVGASRLIQVFREVLDRT